MDPTPRRGTNRSDSSWSSSSSKSSGSSKFKAKTRSVKSWEKQAQEDDRAAHPQRYQWKCPRYNLTWDDLEQFLRRRFPCETFQEFQSGDYWIFNAPEPQTSKDHDAFAQLRPRQQQPQAQPHTWRRPKSPE